MNGRPHMYRAVLAVRLYSKELQGSEWRGFITVSVYWRERERERERDIKFSIYMNPLTSCVHPIVVCSFTSKKESFISKQSMSRSLVQHIVSPNRISIIHTFPISNYGLTSNLQPSSSHQHSIVGCIDPFMLALGQKPIKGVIKCHKNAAIRSISHDIVFGGHGCFKRAHILYISFFQFLTH